MTDQAFEIKTERIRASFLDLKRRHPERLKRRLALSWSNWGFGMEPLADSAARLAKNDIRFIELHGNRYGADMGYRAAEANAILSDHGISVGGICGMFSADNDLSSTRGSIRQNAVDYIRRNVALGRETGAGYFLVVPGAVGRPQKYDDFEFARSVETLRLVADVFTDAGILAAVEPIRSAEVSFCHTVSDAVRYIEAVDHPGVQAINGDVYHMQAEESHIGEAILQAGQRLVNLHMADSNRTALGEGSLDLDAIIMALYLVGFNRDGCFVTPEPLGPGGDPYPAMYGNPDKKVLDEMVRKTATCFREREKQVLSAGSGATKSAAPRSSRRKGG
ncbi:MAG: sugar phosphate isomerase/epimerase family protein [Candidatus Brocadiia bacterium]